MWQVLKGTHLRELTDLYLSLMTVRNLSKGTLRKLVYEIIEIYVSYSSRRFTAILKLSAQRSQQKKNVINVIFGWRLYDHTHKVNKVTSINFWLGENKATPPLEKVETAGRASTWQITLVCRKSHQSWEPVTTFYFISIGQIEAAYWH